MVPEPRIEVNAASRLSCRNAPPMISAVFKKRRGRLGVVCRRGDESRFKICWKAIARIGIFSL